MGINRDHLKKAVRTAVVHAPYLTPDLKARLQYATYRRLHRPFEVDFRALEGLLSPGDLCFDVGANRGQSIEALKMLSFPVRITAFEPQPNLYRRLVRRFSKDLDVIVLPFGASDHPSTTQIYVPYYNGYCFDGLGSLHEQGVEEWLRWSIFRFDERKVEVKAMPCVTVRLDDLDLGTVAFIKLDIQGGEYDALQGLRETLVRDKPQLMIETPSPEVKALLTPLGYQQYNYTNGNLQRSDDPTLNSFLLT